MNLYLRLISFRLRSRRRSRLAMWDTAVTPFRVTLSDLDPLGHVNNSKYLAIMDLARIDLMMRSGWWDKFRLKGWFPVVAGQTITYRKPLTLGQRFDVESRILGMDERWFYIQQVFRSEGTVYAHALVRARFLKKSGGSVEHDEMGEFVGGFPDGLDVPEWIGQWTDGHQGRRLGLQAPARRARLRTTIRREQVGRGWHWQGDAMNGGVRLAAGTLFGVLLAISLAACGDKGDLSVENSGTVDVTVFTGDQEISVPASGAVSVLGYGCTPGDVTVRFASGQEVFLRGPVCPDQTILVGEGTATLTKA